MTPMNIESFETWSLTLCLTGLVLYMAYIIYRLAKDSDAGRFGYVILFFTLGLGMFGFIVKGIVKNFLAI
jgi:hypothetical protein